MPFPDAESALLAFHFLCIPALRLDRLVKHADGQRDFVATTFGSAFEEHIESFRLKVAIGVVVREVDPKLFFQRVHQMTRIGTVAAQVEIDRGGEADGFAFGQTEFFVQQLHEQVHGVVVGEVGREVHGASSVQGHFVRRIKPDFAMRWMSIRAANMELAGRLALTPYDLVHLLHAFHQLIKKLAQGYPRDLIVPTLCVGMQPGTLCVHFESWNAERPLRHPHAERGNDPGSASGGCFPAHHALLGDFQQVAAVLGQQVDGVGDMRDVFHVTVFEALAM